MPPILDVAIGTVFVFLLFSLVVSALNELILSCSDQRAKFLHMGLQELFGEAKAANKVAWRKGGLHRLCGGLLSQVKADTNDWTGRLYQHGLINALSRTDGPQGTSPSYIPAGAFVTALFDLISRNASGTSSAPDAGSPTPNGRSFVQRTLAQLLGWLEKKSDDPAPDPVKLVQSVKDTAAALHAVVAAWPRAEQMQTDDLHAKITTAGTDPAKLLAIAQELQKSLFFGAGESQTSANVGIWINNIQGSPHLQESLRSLFVSVGGDVDKFKVAVEGWFNTAMDRVTGWYKRFSQQWMIVIGFILAAALNVDTIRIVQELSRNPNLAAAVAAQADSYVKGGYQPVKTHAVRKTEIENATAEEQKTLAGAIVTEDAARNSKDEIGNATSPDAAKLEAAVKSRKIAQAALDRKEDDLLMAAGNEAEIAYHQSIAALKDTGIPMGWSDKEQRKELGLDNRIPNLSKFLPLIFGWFLTALAASLGAPFWFDSLSRFVNIRNAGRPPGEKDATSTATKPAPATLDRSPAK